MAARNQEIFLKGVIAHEGSKYTDGVHPYDPGGPTRWGITLTDARLHWKPNATAEDVKGMPIGVAIGIYKSKYWATVRADELPGGVDYSTADYGVNSGIGRAKKVLQRVIGVEPANGRLDDNTMAVLKRKDPKAVINAMNDERINFLQHLAIWPTYKNGWTTRVREVRALSIKLASPASEVPDVQADVTKTVDTTTIAKGMVPEPKTAKNVVKGSGPAAAAEEAARDGGGWIDWITAHPVETGVIVVCVCVIVYGVIHLINMNHRARQEADHGHSIVPDMPQERST